MAHPNHAGDIRLSEAILAVPQLGIACTIVMSDGTPGSGIKLLRSVSKQLRVAMLSAVRGYTFQLDGIGVGLLNEMGLLQDTRLSRLCVIVTDNTDGASSRGLNGWNPYTQHLRCFTTGMSAAIRNITTLKIDTEGMNSNTAMGVATLVSLLAPAVPALQQLQVSSHVGRGLLAAFGSSCPNLSRLVVIDGGAFEALTQLHLVIPGLTHCQVEPPQVAGDWLPPVAPCCLVLLSCTSLTRLDVGPATLSLDMWNSLPSGLRELHCALTPEPLVGLSILSLQTFRCSCTFSGNCIEMASLVAVLRVSPELQSLHVVGWGLDSERSNFISEVYFTCSASSISDLVYLNGRVSSGLAVTSTRCAGGEFLGLNLSVSLWSDNDQYATFTEFLVMLPPLPAITGLILCSDVAEHSISAISRAIASVFPSITALVLELPQSISTQDLARLGSFTSLQHLSLQDAEVTEGSLAMLCSRLVALKVLRLERCGEFAEEDGELLQSLLHDFSLKIEVMIVSRDRVN